MKTGSDGLADPIECVLGRSGVENRSGCTFELDDLFGSRSGSALVSGAAAK